MSFERRPLPGPDTLGERLRQLRTEAGWSVMDVSKQIRVATKHIEAIEDNRYRDLPGLVYARNFVRLYVRLMDLPVESAMERFETEWQVIQGARQERTHLVQRAKTEPEWWRRHAGFLVAGIFLVIAGLYFSWQVLHFLQPPKLEVTTPAADISTGASTITIIGKTEPEATVTVNNQVIDVQKDGTFSDAVQLQVGLNTFQISATRKKAKPRTIIRRVLYEAPATDTPVTSPTTNTNSSPNTNS